MTHLVTAPLCGKMPFRRRGQNGDQDLSGGPDNGVLAGDHESADSTIGDRFSGAAAEPGKTARGFWCAPPVEKKTVHSEPGERPGPRRQGFPARANFGQHAPSPPSPCWPRARSWGSSPWIRDFSAEDNIRPTTFANFPCWPTRPGLALENSRLYEYIEQANTDPCPRPGKALASKRKSWPH